MRGGVQRELDLRENTVDISDRTDRTVGVCYVAQGSAATGHAVASGGSDQSAAVMRAR